jgi:hypothetical protein
MVENVLSDFKSFDWSPNSRSFSIYNRKVLAFALLTEKSQQKTEDSAKRNQGAAMQCKRVWLSRMSSPRGIQKSSKCASCDFEYPSSIEPYSMQ